jgi:8-oxo-dGTP diphosphatase
MPPAKRRAPPPPPDTPNVSDTLATERLILRPPVPADAEQLHRLVNDWSVVRMLSRLPFPYPRTLTDEWIASTVDQRARGTGYHLVITGHEDGQELVIGCVGLNLDVTPGTANLGYWVGRRYWGHGVATEAVGRAARWALANLPVTRLEAHVAEDNPASSAVLRRIGLRETGHDRRPFLARGGEHPVICFEATREDLFGEVEAPLPPATPDAVPGAALGKPLLLVAACALIDTDNRVLLARRPEGKKMAGLWEFPGGKLNPGEIPEHALIRELKEELGIDVAEACLAAFAFASHDYDRFHLLMPLFLCRRWKGTPAGLEGQALAWVRPNKLTDYDMPPADKPLIPLLRDFL